MKTNAHPVQENKSPSSDYILDLQRQIADAKAALEKASEAAQSKEAAAARAEKEHGRPLSENEKAVKAVELKDHKKTFAEIGSALGVSPDRAKNLVIMGRDMLGEHNAFRGLTERSTNILRENLFKSRDSVIHALKTGLIRMEAGKGCNMAGMDEACFVEICEWCGLTLEPTKETRKPDDPVNEGNKYTYQISWSPEMVMNVGICLEFPMLHYSGSSPNSALDGIKRLVNNTITALVKAGAVVPQPLHVKEKEKDVASAN